MWRIAFIVAGGSGLIILAVFFAILGLSLMPWKVIVFFVVYYIAVYTILGWLKGGKKKKHKKQVKAMKVVQEVKAPKKSLRVGANALLLIYQSVRNLN